MSEEGYPVNGYTRADNWLWDYVMPRARPNTFKIVAAVMRETAGWHRPEARLTLTEFGTMTGIGSRTTLVAAIEEALAKGFIERRACGASHRYRLHVVPVQEVDREQSRKWTGDGPEAGPAEASPVQKVDQEQSRKWTANGPETGPAEARPVQKVDQEQSRKWTANGTENGPSSIIKRKGERKGKESFPPGGGQTEPPSTPAFPEEDGSAPEGEPLAPGDTPYGVYQRLARLEPGIRKGQTLAEAKRLLAGDPEANLAAYSGEEIVACARFLQSEPWRRERMIPLSTRHIMEKIARWVEAGRPETWADWQAGNGSGEEVEPAGFAAIRAFLGDRGLGIGD